MNIEEVKLFFLLNFGVKPQSEVSLQKLDLIVYAAARWHGRFFAQFVMDCFDPLGMEDEEIQAYTHYCANFTSWEELELWWEENDHSIRKEVAT